MAPLSILEESSYEYGNVGYGRRRRFLAAMGPWETKPHRLIAMGSTMKKSIKAIFRAFVQAYQKPYQISVSYIEKSYQVYVPGISDFCIKYSDVYSKLVSK